MNYGKLMTKKNSDTEKELAEVWADKLEALESRNAFQDDIIDQLNQELTVHQQDITELKYQLKLIASRLKEGNNSPATTDEVEPPPPHY